jgi:uncharacterized membrane protein
MAFPLDWAELLALFLENIVFGAPLRFASNKKSSQSIVFHTLGIFLTFFIILVAICFAKDSIRIANRKFVLSVATVMMVLAIAVCLYNMLLDVSVYLTRYISTL